MAEVTGWGDAPPPTPVKHEHVPTAAELEKMGPQYAVAIDWVNDGTAKHPRMRATRWRITDAGHALMGEAMARNARLGPEPLAEIIRRIKKETA